MWSGAPVTQFRSSASPCSRPTATPCRRAGACSSGSLTPCTDSRRPSARSPNARPLERFATHRPADGKNPGGQDPSGPPGESGWLGASPDPRDELLRPSFVSTEFLSVSPAPVAGTTRSSINRTNDPISFIKLIELDQPFDARRVYMSVGGDDEGASEGASLWLTSFRLVAFGWGRGVLGLRIPGAPPGRRPRNRPRHVLQARSGTRPTCGPGSERTARALDFRR